MAGKPGRSGTWIRHTPAEHALRGTRSRARVVPMVPSIEPMPTALTEGLTGPGLQFVQDCWTTYGGWTPPTLVLLKQAGRLLDDLESLRGQRGERQAQRLLVSVLAALQLRD